MPMVAAISGLFTSTFEESLKRLVQPVGLIPAALFFLLHMVVTYPVLLSAGQPTVVGIDGLSDLWKVSLGLAAVLGLGYIIQSATPWIGEVFSGDALPFDSWVAQTLRRQQRRALVGLSGRIEAHQRRSEEHLDLELERMQRFPWDDDAGNPADQVSPTALGNAFLAAAWAVWNAHGVDPTAVWAHMRTVLKKEQPDLLQAIDDEKTAIDTLLNSAFVLIVFAGSAALLNASVGDFGAVPHAAAALLVAYGIYRVAIRRVASWSVAMQAAFDLHRDKLAEALGLRVAGGSVDSLAWRVASQAIAWSQGLGRLRAQLADSVSIQASGSLVATALPALEWDEVDSPDGAGWGERRYCWETLMALRSTGSKDAVPSPQHVVTSDARLPNIPCGPEYDVDGPSGVVVTPSIRRGDSDNPDAIVWTIQDLGAGGELLLRYRTGRRVRAEILEPAGSRASVRVDRAADDRPEMYRIRLEAPEVAVGADDAEAGVAGPSRAKPFEIRVADDGIRAGRRRANWMTEGRDPIRTGARAVDGTPAWVFTVPGDHGMNGELGVLEDTTDE